MNKLGIKNFLLIVFSVVLIGSLFILLESKNTRNSFVVENTNNNPQILLQNDKIDSYLDSDNDGLKDWEENLWGTDPSNPDTDKDGTSDGKEISLGRNPLKKGTTKVSDKLSTSTKVVVQVAETETDSFAKNLFAKYMALRQLNISGDATARENLVNELMSSSESDDVAPKYFTKSIKTVENTAENLRVYGNQLATIYLKYTDKYKENPIIASESEMAEDRSKLLAQFKSTSLIFEALNKELLFTPVPKQLVGLHTDLMNSLNSSAVHLAQFSTLEKDPFKAFRGLSSQQTDAVNQENILQNISSILTSSNITYSSFEKGYYLANH
ncbi:MAG: hypothetical protein Q7R78_01305 [bacterium]|nr:hypothetical protein [bacterium]